MKNSLGESSINLVGCSSFIVPIFSVFFFYLIYILGDPFSWFGIYNVHIESHHDSHFLSFNIKENWLFLRRSVLE